jgi:hypothetical protein
VPNQINKHDPQLFPWILLAWLIAVLSLLFWCNFKIGQRARRMAAAARAEQEWACAELKENRSPDLTVDSSFDV